MAYEIHAVNNDLAALREKLTMKPQASLADMDHAGKPRHFDPGGIMVRLSAEEAEWLVGLIDRVTPQTPEALATAPS